MGNSGGFPCQPLSAVQQMLLSQHEPAAWSHPSGQKVLTSENISCPPPRFLDFYENQSNRFFFSSPLELYTNLPLSFLLQLGELTVKSLPCSFLLKQRTSQLGGRLRTTRQGTGLLRHHKCFQESKVLIVS